VNILSKLLERRAARNILKQEYCSCLDMLRACIDSRKLINAGKVPASALVRVREVEIETEARMREIRKELGR